MKIRYINFAVSEKFYNRLFQVGLLTTKYINGKKYVYLRFDKMWLEMTNTKRLLKISWKPCLGCRRVLYR
ncbi:MAG: hypothetical protein L0Y56_21400 [Nitrospira sp.]|nr:hypothetical protein [Nitrospira sp.]